MGSGLLGKLASMWLMRWRGSIFLCEQADRLITGRSHRLKRRTSRSRGTIPAYVRVAGCRLEKGSGRFDQCP